MAESDVQAILIKLERMDQRLETIIETGDDHEERLRNLEAKPAKKLDSIINYILAAIVGGIIAYGFSMIQK